MHLSQPLTSSWPKGKGVGLMSALSRGRGLLCAEGMDVYFSQGGNSPLILSPPLHTGEMPFPRMVVSVHACFQETMTSQRLNVY